MIWRGDRTRRPPLAKATTAPASADEAAAIGPAPTVGRRVGRYTLERELGRDRRDNQVWVARDPQLAREVAITLYRPIGSDARAGERLRDAAQAVGRISHAAVARVYELGTAGPFGFCAMERLDGVTVRAWLATARPWREVLARIVAAGRGLAAAHEGGVVHGDLSLDSLVVTNDGRTVVTGFGLADPGGGRGTIGDGDGDGGCAGEPGPSAAPVPADDQRALAALGFEALFGRRHDDGGAGAWLCAAIDRRVARRPALGGVEPAVARGLVRGLAPEPTDRWPSVAELLDAVEAAGAPRHRRAGWRIGGGLAVIALLVAAWFLGAPADVEGEVRAAGSMRMERGWNAQQRAALKLAFARLGPPSAGEVERRVIGALDRYRAAWLDARVEAWRAAREGGAAVRRRLEVQLACFDRLAEEFVTYVRLVAAREQPEELRRAASGADLLTPISGCTDPGELADQIATDGGRDAAVIRTVELEEARLRAMLRAGRPEECVVHATRLIAEAERLGQPRLHAELLRLLAIAQNGLDELDASERTLRRLILVAARSRLDRLVASGWTLLVELLVTRSRSEEAQGLAPAARAAVALAGDDAYQLADLEGVLGGLHARLEQREQAARCFEACYRGFAAARGPSFHLAIECQALHANALARLGRGDEAWGLERAAYQQARAALGEHDPITGRILSRLSSFALERGDVPSAISYGRSAVEVMETIYGASAANTAYARATLGNALSEHGEHADAAVALRRAVTDLTRRLGAGEADVLSTRMELAIALGQGGDVAAADRIAVEVTRLLRQSYPHDTISIRYALLQHAAILGARQPARALALFDQGFALRWLADPSVQEDAEYLEAAAVAALAAGQPARALRWLDAYPASADLTEDVRRRLSAAVPAPARRGGRPRETSRAPK